MLEDLADTVDQYMTRRIYEPLNQFYEYVVESLFIYQPNLSFVPVYNDIPAARFYQPDIVDYFMDRFCMTKSNNTNRTSHRQKGNRRGREPGTKASIASRLKKQGKLPTESLVNRIWNSIRRNKGK